MIVRVLAGRVNADRLILFREETGHALAEARLQAGFVHAHIGRQSHKDGSEEVLIVSVWRDLESLYRWVRSSDLLDTPVIGRATTDIFVHYDIQHYDTLEPLSADDAGGAVPEMAKAPEP